MFLLLCSMFTSMSVYISFPCRTLDLTTRDITGPETTCPVELQFVGAGELLLAKLLTPKIPSANKGLIGEVVTNIRLS